MDTYMDTYRIVLYVTQEQDNSIRNLFYDSGWSYLKASLAVSDYNPQDTQTFLEQLCRESSLPPSTDDFLELECSQSVCERKLDSAEPLHATVEPVDSIRASVLSDAGITQMSDLLYPSETCRDYMDHLNLPIIPDKQLNDLDSFICKDLQHSLSPEHSKGLGFEEDILCDVSKHEHSGGNESGNALGKHGRIDDPFQLNLETPSFTTHSDNASKKQSSIYLSQQSRMNNNVNINEQTRYVSNLNAHADNSLKTSENCAKMLKSSQKMPTCTEKNLAIQSTEQMKKDTGIIPCGTCKNRFSNFNTYESHKKDCKFVCPVCEKVFAKSTHSTIKAHMKCHRNKREYKCTQCDKAYNLPAQLNNHMLTHCEQKQYICDICGVSCTYLSSLKSHRQKMHFETEERHTCTTCGLSLKSNYNLKYHIRQVHSEDRPYECTICNNRYKTKYVYETHMGTHDEKCEFKCTTCTKIFKRKSLLTAHMKLHNQQFSHFCPTCEKGFHSNNKLSIHLRVHSGERPYKCDVCDYSSAIKGNLTKHLRRHDSNDEAKHEAKSTDKRSSSEEPIGQLNTTFDAFDALELSNLSSGGFSTDVGHSLIKGNLKKQLMTHITDQNTPEAQITSVQQHTHAQINTEHTPVDRHNKASREGTPVVQDKFPGVTAMATSPQFARFDGLSNAQHVETDTSGKERSPAEPGSILSTSAFDAFDALDLSNISAAGFGTDACQSLSFNDVTFK